ncbi:MAG: hypothetical protein AAGA54_04030 [Myxococcota bacterium]
MHLLPQVTTKPAPSVLPLHGPSNAGAANDSGITGRTQTTRQVNTLVAGVVGQVAARVQSKNVNIQLRLAPGEPTVSSDPAELAFVVGAMLGAALRVVGEENGEYVGVHVSAARSKVRVSVTSDGVPPLRFVRALDPSGGSEDVDPTLAHCRRLVEARGGALTLTEQGGRIGFAVELPRAVLSPRLRLLPTAVAEFGPRRAA